MTQPLRSQTPLAPARRAWCPPVEPARYDRSPELRPGEREAIATVQRRRAPDPRQSGAWPRAVRRAFARLLDPVHDVLAATGACTQDRKAVVGVLLRAMHARQTTFCTYGFFDQCPHRMACAKYAFYRPKGSSQAQMLEAKTNLLRLKQDIPLTDDERAAVDDGLEALEKLCSGLADVPTPAGPTPRQLRGRETLPSTVVPAPSAARPATGEPNPQ